MTLQQIKVGSSEHRSIHNDGKSTKVYVNVDEAGNVGSSKVDIQGNIMTHNEYANTEDLIPVTNIALTTAESKLHGLIETGDRGKTNLWLQNDASWTNEHYATGLHLTSSRLTKFTGGADSEDRKSTV